MTEHNIPVLEQAGLVADRKLSGACGAVLLGGGHASISNCTWGHRLALKASPTELVIANVTNLPKKMT